MFSSAAISLIVIIASSYDFFTESRSTNSVVTVSFCYGKPRILNKIHKMSDGCPCHGAEIYS